MGFTPAKDWSLQCQVFYSCLVFPRNCFILPRETVKSEWKEDDEDH